LHFTIKSVVISKFFVDINPNHLKALKAMTICCYMLEDTSAYQSYCRRAVANGVDKEELTPYYIEELAAQLEDLRNP